MVVRFLSMVRRVDLEARPPLETPSELGGHLSFVLREFTVLEIQEDDIVLPNAQLLAGRERLCFAQRTKIGLRDPLVVRCRAVG
jgi:hypothetical protein